MPYTDFHYTPTGTGVISGKEVLEQTEDAINDLGGQISGDVQTAIDTANNALNTANTASADAQNAVNTANTAYTAATNAQNTANAAQNTASNALTAAQTAQNDVNALGNRVTTAENNITQNTTDISGLTTRMGTAEGNITTLQNDVVTAQGTATSAQNTATLARGQAYVVRYASVAVSDNSSVPYTDLNNVDNIKANDLLLDTNGKLYQISSVDTVNETAAVTTPLTVLALDVNVMHLSGDETAPGKKTFADLTTFNSWLYFTNSLVTKGTIPESTVNPYRIYFGSGVNYGASLFNIDTSVSNTGVQTLTLRSAENVVSGDDSRMMLVYDPNRTQPRYLSSKGDIEPNSNNTYDCGSSSNIWKDLYVYHGYFCGWKKGDEYSSNARTVLTLLANRDTLGKSCAYITRFRQNRAQGAMQPLDLQSIAFDVVENEVRTNNVLSIQCTDWLNDVPQRVNIVCGAQSYSFGNSANKALINGLNPGALSFPDLSSGLDISGYITVPNTHNTYTPPVNGWISVVLKSTSGALALFMYQGDLSSGNYSATSLPNETDPCVMCCLPVVGNTAVSIDVKGSNAYVVSAKFYPNLGNV